MKNCVIGVCFMVSSLCAHADEVYQVTGDLPSGLDLTSKSGYYADRLKTPVAGSSATVTGEVTIDSTVSASHPFTVIGAGGTLTFASCGSFATTPFIFDGTGKTVFSGGDARSRRHYRIAASVGERRRAGV